MCVCVCARQVTGTQQAYKTNNSPPPPDGGLCVESSDSVNVQRLSLRRSATRPI